MGGENPVDPCSPNPCTHGTCESDGTSYSCTCDTGYRGDSCAINIDDCAGNPCTHGTCIDGVASYQCDCGNTGYAGKLCDTLIQNCAQTPCSNGGVCMDLDASRTCDCTGTGATGTSCEVDIDECATNPCAHGTCVNGKNQYTCNCGSTGYKGTNCDVDIDECDSHPCDPLTTCNNSSGSFSCSSCPPGYSGSGLKGCNNIDDCAGNPCKNGGTCTDGVNAFTCACPSPWSGSTCQNATLSIDMSARGFYADANWFPPSTGNTETGWSGDFGYASYLIFAIPSFTGTVSGVTLRLEHVNYDSPDPSEIVLVSDVTTPVATLLSNTSANQTIYQDLAGGTQYGSLTGWTASTVGTVRSFSLSGALTAVSNARGTSFAIGVSLSSLSKSTVPETVSFSQNTETRVNQLQVVVTP